MCEDLGPILGHYKRVLPLGARLQVSRDDFPAEGVIGIDKHPPCAHVDHGLDGEHHAWDKQHALLPLGKVANLGILVELEAHAMTREVAHHTVAMLVGIGFDGAADVVHITPGAGGLDADFQALLGHTDEPLLGRSGLTDDKHARGVGIVAVEDGREVHIYNITLTQDIPGLGNAMTHHLVDACTHTHGETLIAQTCGHRTMIGAILTADLVNLQCRHAGMDFSLDGVKDASVDNTGAADALDLLWGLDQVPCGNDGSPALQFHNAAVKLGGFPLGNITQTMSCHFNNLGINDQ